jgi:DNA-binding MarR family transcriptional regulator
VGKPLELPFDPIDRAAQIWERRFGPSPSMAAVTSIMRAQQILLGELDALLRPYGLTFARYEALVLLTFSRRGALPLGVIGERLMVHPTSVTNIISRLERQQMVVRRPNPADGRGRLAEITDAGRDVVARATRDLMEAEFGLGGYGPGQLKEIFDLFRELRLAAGDFVPDPGRDQTPRSGLAVEPGRRPGLPAVKGEPDRAARRVGGQRDALVVGGHAHVAEPPGRRAPLQRRRLPADLALG